jgi:hypothetical protein
MLGRLQRLKPSADVPREETVGGEQAPGVNSDFFRSVNAQILGLGAMWHNEFGFICECDDAGCTRVMVLDADEYAVVRSDPRQFAVVCGHEQPASDEVILRTDRYVLVRACRVADPTTEDERP